MASRGATPEFSGVTLVARMSCAFASPCTHTAASIKSEGSTSILSRHPMPVPGRRAHADFLACRPMRASIMRACVHARASSSFWLFAFPLACRDAGGGWCRRRGTTNWIFFHVRRGRAFKGPNKNRLPPPPSPPGWSLLSLRELSRQPRADRYREKTRCLPSHSNDIAEPMEANSVSCDSNLAAR